jgi:tetratricopeptide (TPR) repeat protein
LLLAAQLGNASGPLHATGRAWLKTQGHFPEQPTLYVCDLQYMAWRDSRRVADGAAAINCYDKILLADPDNAMALAADAGLKAWRAHYTAATSQDLVALLADQTTAASRAVSLQPADSFVYEQQGLVLARQGSLDAATGALNKAVELNPASMDAVAATGLVTWLNGSFGDGSALGEQAINEVTSPPPWYYMTRAFNALREKRYYDAIDAAQALAAGDEEFGPAVALAAAPVVGRADIIDRYRPQVLANSYFQSAGVMPRLIMMMKPQILVDRVREGLVLAGIPPAALDGPFNPDGTGKR